MLGICLHQRQSGFLRSPLRCSDLDFAAAHLRQKLFQFLALVQSPPEHGSCAGTYAASDIDLLEQRLKKFRRVELFLIFPEELPAVDDLAISQMEQIHRNQRRLRMIGKDIDVLAFRPPPSSASAPSREQSSTRLRRPAASSKRISSEAACIRLCSSCGQVAMPPFEKQTHVPHRRAYASSVVSPSTHGPRQRWMWYCRQGCVCSRSKNRSCRKEL